MFECLSVLQPDRTDLFVRLGDIYKKKKFYKEAAFRYWTALSIQPADPYVRRSLLETYTLLSGEEKEELNKLEQQNSFAQTP